MYAFKNGKRKLNIKSIVFYAICAIFCIAACVFLSYTNVTPAVALEQEIRCGIEEHTHTDDCYNGDLLLCEKPSHTHDGNCYIVLLKENDINSILTLLGESEDHSLENVITDTVSTALTFNDNLNSQETEDNNTLELSQDTVAELNDTVSTEEELPNIVFNENINSIKTLASKEETDNTQNNTTPNNATLNNATNSITQNNAGATTFSIGDQPQTSNNVANYYVYLDNKWTCIGSTSFTVYSQQSGWWTYYYSRVATDDMLELVNTSMETDFAYDDFSLAVSSSQNNNYSTNNVSINSTTTTLGRSTSSNTANSTKYVRLIPVGGGANSTGFAFYTVTYEFLDGTNKSEIVKTGTRVTLPVGYYQWSDGSSTYNAGDTVNITKTTTFTASEIPEVESLDIFYDVNFPSGNWATVQTKPTIAGITQTTVTDVHPKGSEVTIRNVSQQSVQGAVNGNDTGLTRVFQFKGWRVGDTDIIIQPNTKLIWEELINYSKNTNYLALTAVWDYDPLQTASFFIRFDSVAVDTEGNITGQDSNKYTKQIFAAYVGGVDVSLGTSNLQKEYGIADTTSDNSFGADQKIRSLYGERTDGVWLSAFPSDDFVFENLVQYANTGYLSVDGEPVKAEDLNSRAYAIRWYVFKSQDDAWHIDGKLVKKHGLIHVYKTFAGNKELVTEAKEDFYIDATDISADTNTVLTLDNRTAYDENTDTYMWEITDVDYGELWQITEHPHLFADPNVDFGVYSEYTVMDAHGDQSITDSGTSITVSGMTYALDEGTDEVLRAEFTNIYNKNNSIIIKKQDALTGVSIGGATFRLKQNGQALKFNYNSESDSYEYDPENGQHTVLSGTVNGYFEISIEDFSYDFGNIIVEEVTAPTGYSPIGNIEIGYTDDQKTIGIISGNSEMIKYVNGILIVGNSTDVMSVTAKKQWDCPENEWQPVTMQLLANGKLVTTVIAGVQPQVVLSEDNNWQHTWTNLPVYVNGSKIEWSIKETAIGTETAKADGSFVNWLASYEIPIQATDKDGNPHITLTVTNTTKRVMLRLTKTDLSKTLQLKDATFMLDVVDDDGNAIPTEIVKTATTGEAGTLIFDNLKCGVRYRLIEQHPPDEYLGLPEFIYFTINEDGSVAVEESFYAEAGNTAYNLIVRNAKGIPLPESGGIGTGMFYAFGLLFMVVAISIYIRHLRKRRCHD